MSEKDIDEGTYVDIVLRGKSRSGVVVKKVSKPSFKCEEIVSIKDEFLPKNRLKIVKFISSYYLSFLGDAFGLFVPFSIQKDFKDIKKIFNAPVLSIPQKKAFLSVKKEQISLLFGDTNSGKTEIYISLIKNIVEKNQTVIFLIPEISLTPQMEKRLKIYFGDMLAIWHSKITKKRKKEILDGINKGTIKVVAGARSALFLPMPNLGLIVVDEEHDSSYKSNSRPRYNARDLSIYFAKVLGIKVLLGSATPSLNSYYKLKSYRLKESYIKSSKEFIYEKSSDDISENILSNIAEILSRKKQAIIFLPTRANFKYISCFECGEVIKCPFCSVGMSLHKYNNILKCHYCGYAQKIPQKCPSCDSLHLGSFRMGTEEVKERLCKIFPNANIEKFDRDAIKSEKKLKEILQNFNDKKIDILVGTQMLSKGHDYCNIELAVILGIDSILSQNDFKARENALSLAVQIAGRSGRGGEGRVILQTSNEDFFKEYMGDYEKFLKDELKFREGLYPPFKKLLRVLISHKDRNKAIAIMEKVLKCIKKYKDKNVQIVGSGEAVIEKIGGKYRYNILLRSDSATSILKAVSLCRENFCEIDMDPLSFS